MSWTVSEGEDDDDDDHDQLFRHAQWICIVHLWKQNGVCAYCILCGVVVSFFNNFSLCLFVFFHLYSARFVVRLNWIREISEFCYDRKVLPEQLHRWRCCCRLITFLFELSKEKSTDALENVLSLSISLSVCVFFFILVVWYFTAPSQEWNEHTGMEQKTTAAAAAAECSRKNTFREAASL